MLTYSSWRHSSLAREMAVFFMCELIICSLSFNVVSGHGGHIYGNEAWKIQVGLFFRVMSAVSLMSARLNCYNKILPKVLRQQAKAVVIQRFRSEGSHLTSVTWDLGLTGHYNYISKLRVSLEALNWFFLGSNKLPATHYIAQRNYLRISSAKLCRTRFYTGNFNHC